MSRVHGSSRSAFYRAPSHVLPAPKRGWRSLLGSRWATTAAASASVLAAAAVPIRQPAHRPGARCSFSLTCWSCGAASGSSTDACRGGTCQGCASADPLQSHDHQFSQHASTKKRTVCGAFGSCQHMHLTAAADYPGHPGSAVLAENTAHDGKPCKAQRCNCLRQPSVDIHMMRRRRAASA